MRNILSVIAITVLAAAAATSGQGSQAANEALWEASRAGDTAAITAALAKGADVNSKSRYDVTPLIFAAGNGKFDAVKTVMKETINDVVVPDLQGIEVMVQTFDHSSPTNDTVLRGQFFPEGILPLIDEMETNPENETTSCR